MSYLVNKLENNSILRVTYNGEVDFDARLSSLQDVIKIFQQDSRQYNLLIDNRNLTNELSTLDAFDFGEKLSLTKELRGCRIAVILGLSPDNHKFVHTVALNRGHFFKEFNSYDEAISWLNNKQHLKKNKRH